MKTAKKCISFLMIFILTLSVFSPITTSARSEITADTNLSVEPDTLQEADDHIFLDWNGDINEELQRLIDGWDLDNELDLNLDQQMTLSDYIMVYYHGWDETIVQQVHRDDLEAVTHDFTQRAERFDALSGSLDDHLIMEIERDYLGWPEGFDPDLYIAPTDNVMIHYFGWEEKLIFETTAENAEEAIAYLLERDTQSVAEMILQVDAFVYEDTLMIMEPQVDAFINEDTLLIMESQVDTVEYVGFSYFPVGMDYPVVIYVHTDVLNTDEIYVLLDYELARLGLRRKITGIKIS